MATSTNAIGPRPGITKVDLIKYNVWDNVHDWNTSIKELSYQTAPCAVAPRRGRGAGDECKRLIAGVRQWNEDTVLNRIIDNRVVSGDEEHGDENKQYTSYDLYNTADWKDKKDSNQVMEAMTVSGCEFATKLGEHVINKPIFLIVDTYKSIFMNDLQNHRHPDQHIYWCKITETEYDPGSKSSIRTKPYIFSKAERTNGKGIQYVEQYYTQGQTAGILYPPWTDHNIEFTYTDGEADLEMICSKHKIHLISAETKYKNNTKRESYALIHTNNGFVYSDSAMASKSKSIMDKITYKKNWNKIKGVLRTFIIDKRSKLSGYTSKYNLLSKRLGDQSQALACKHDNIAFQEYGARGVAVNRDTAEKTQHPKIAPSLINSQEGISCFVSYDRPAIGHALNYNVPLVLYLRTSQTENGYYATLYVRNDKKINVGEDEAKKTEAAAAAAAEAAEAAAAAKAEAAEAAAAAKAALDTVTKQIAEKQVYYNEVVVDRVTNIIINHKEQINTSVSNAHDANYADVLFRKTFIIYLALLPIITLINQISDIDEAIANTNITNITNIDKYNNLKNKNDILDILTTIAPGTPNTPNTPSTVEILNQINTYAENQDNDAQQQAVILVGRDAYNRINGYKPFTFIPVSRIMRNSIMPIYEESFGILLLPKLNYKYGVDYPFKNAIVSLFNISESPAGFIKNAHDKMKEILDHDNGQTGGSLGSILNTEYGHLANDYNDTGNLATGDYIDMDNRAAGAYIGMDNRAALLSILLLYINEMIDDSKNLTNTITFNELRATVDAGNEQRHQVGRSTNDMIIINAGVAAQKTLREARKARTDGNAYDNIYATLCEIMYNGETETFLNSVLNIGDSNEEETKEEEAKETKEEEERRSVEETESNNGFCTINHSLIDYESLSDLTERSTTGIHNRLLYHINKLVFDEDKGVNDQHGGKQMSCSQNNVLSTGHELSDLKRDYFKEIRILTKYNKNFRGKHEQIIIADLQKANCKRKHKIQQKITIHHSGNHNRKKTCRIKKTTNNKLLYKIAHQNILCSGGNRRKATKNRNRKNRRKATKNRNRKNSRKATKNRNRKNSRKATKNRNRKNSRKKGTRRKIA
jgi:hypothetical protein